MNGFHRGYETVAVAFGLTEENCPDRGRASYPLHKLVADYENGIKMYGYFDGGVLVGFLGTSFDKDTLFLHDLIVLPAHRKRGIGQALLDFCKKSARELGATSVQLSMIDDNMPLRKWYEKNGFVNIDYKKYEGAPFTVGNMECLLS